MSLGTKARFHGPGQPIGLNSLEPSIFTSISCCVLVLTNLLPICVTGSLPAKQFQKGLAVGHVDLSAHCQSSGLWSLCGGLYGKYLHEQ